MYPYTQAIEPTATTDGEFTDGDPQAQLARTILRSFWPNQIQRELLNILSDPHAAYDAQTDTYSTETPQKNQYDQIVKCINNIAQFAAGSAAAAAEQAAKTYAANTAQFAAQTIRPIGMIEQGPYTIIPPNAIALDHSIKSHGLGYGAGLYHRANFPILWNWIKQNLAIVPDVARGFYPGSFTEGDGVNTFRVPDMRGLFTRGYGGNSGAIGRQQGDAIRNIKGSYSPIPRTGGGDVTSTSGAISSTYNAWSSDTDGSGRRAENLYFDASKVVPTSVENRPVNVAWRWIVWADHVG